MDNYTRYEVTLKVVVDQLNTIPNQSDVFKDITTDLERMTEELGGCEVQSINKLGTWDPETDMPPAGTNIPEPVLNYLRDMVEITVDQFINRRS